MVVVAVLTSVSVAVPETDVLDTDSTATVVVAWFMAMMVLELVTVVVIEEVDVGATFCEDGTLVSEVQTWPEAQGVLKLTTGKVSVKELGRDTV